MIGLIWWLFTWPARARAAAKVIPYQATPRMHPTLAQIVAWKGERNRLDITPAWNRRRA